jgi:hypothetical protein
VLPNFEIYVERSFILPRSKFTQTHNNKTLTLTLRVTYFLFSPFAKNAPKILWFSLQKYSCAKRVWAMKIKKHAKVHEKRKHAKELDAYKK